MGVVEIDCHTAILDASRYFGGYNAGFVEFFTAEQPFMRLCRKVLSRILFKIFDRGHHLKWV